MTKPADAPPDNGKGSNDKAPRPDATPPDIRVPADDLVPEVDATLEWSVHELALDVSSEADGDEATQRPPPDGAGEPVFRWHEPGADRDDVVVLPPELNPPPGELRTPSGRVSHGVYDEESTAPSPLVTAEEPPGALPLDTSQAGETPRETSDEELVILEAVPPIPEPHTTASSAPTAPIPPEASRPSPPRAPTPPPVPAAAQAASAKSASILLPDIPVELVGAAAPGAWPEALAQRPRKKRLRPWFEEVFDEDYLRTLPFMTAEQTLREVAFIKEFLVPPPDGHVLDVACGYGRHAIELSQRGLKVTGLDLSLPLLIRAADESQRRSLSVNFVHADMREMAFDGQFDGAYCVLSSFGYFDEETNLKVASAICRALKPGGRFLLDTLNRDYIVSDLPTRVWWEGDGCVVLEEVDFNFHTSRVIIRRSVVFQDGRQVEQDISIRAYSLHELGKLLRQAGFRVLDVSGSLATKGNFFGATSRNIIMVCERPTG
jgi:SAM-dependent methyltransferase